MKQAVSLLPFSGTHLGLSTGVLTTVTTVRLWSLTVKSAMLAALMLAMNI